MKIVIRDNQRGLLIKNGRLDRVLGPGRHDVWAPFADVEVQKLDIDRGYAEMTPELEAAVPRSDAVPFVVPSDKVGCVAIDGRPTAVLEPGHYLLWHVRAEVTGELVSTEPLVSALPPKFRELAPRALFMDVKVQPYQRVLAYVDGVLAEVLESGRYLLSQKDRRVETYFVDLREQELQVVGQEVMTADKVTLRVNVIVSFRITDPVLATESVDELHRALYTEAQMAARRFVAGHTVEAMLESRNEAAETMAADIRERARGWGADVLRVDLKDVILPGDMKAILNRVIEAEKTAEANVILRREETAATRSLANTAKLLEQNPTLLRLKELEAYKEMLQDIDNVTLVAGESLTRLLS